MSRDGIPILVNESNCVSFRRSISYCAAHNGGIFEKDQSSTWVEVADVKYLDPGIEQNYNSSGNLGGFDILRVNSTLSLNNISIGLPNGELRLNTLGLGQNSTLLARLSSAGAIASKTWAYFHGLTGAEKKNQVDGSLILGGYDSAKTVGDKFTQPLQYVPSCTSGLVAIITDIKMSLQNGSVVSIIGPSRGAALQACITPDAPTVNLPLNIWDTFLEISGSNAVGRSLGINGWGMLISADTAYVYTPPYQINHIKKLLGTMAT